MTVNLSALSAPFDPAAIHWRIQGKPFERNGSYSAMALAYLDARDVMDRLDAVCGPENWQTEYHETAKGRLICRLSIYIGGVWVTKSDGAGDTDVEGEKGAISDALKRAAVSWGIGRYLYRIESPWVPCEVNDKGQWKRWTVDPWAKVKNAPATTSPPRPAFDPVAAHDRIIKRIEGAKDYDSLCDVWAAEQETVMQIGKERADLGRSLYEARNLAKANLQQKDAA